MQESEQCVQEAARDGAPFVQLVANRILESSAVWSRWENEHAVLMRTVSDQRRPTHQVSALKATCFSLIHRKALFEYLRDQRVRGADRRQILQFFHRTSGYTHAAIAEHENYLRSACSYLCSGQVGDVVIGDGVFQHPMRRYEELFGEYFKLFCESSKTDASEADSARVLLPYLRFQLKEQRLAVLAMPRITPAVHRDAKLRQRTGDTVKLRVDALRAHLGGSSTH